MLVHSEDKRGKKGKVCCAERSRAVKAAMNCWTWWEIFASCNMAMLKTEKAATWRGSYPKEWTTIS